jgi:bifunctional NMN adenylyltransferase/nudix hydrolase
MKKAESPTADVGIIIGRFQIHELHEGHIDLIQSVCNIHPKVIIFLGLSPVLTTQNNPLDFESRKQMILEKFPHVNVLYIKDQKSDKEWSKDLDEKIKDLVTPNQSVTLYGSRDSFIKYYTGKYPTQELVQERYISASEIRKGICKKVKNTPEFRAGVIWASGNRFPTCFPCVDIAIFNEDYTKILLAKKSKESLYRFVGGFADPKSNCYESDAIREVQEETGLEIGDLKYIGSTIINDFRYNREIDKIKTLFFIGKILFGRPEANDDICEVKFFDIDKLKEADIMPEHNLLFDMLKKYLKKS